jgi:hypothetical protein
MRDALADDSTVNFACMYTYIYIHIHSVRTEFEDIGFRSGTVVNFPHQLAGFTLQALG